MDSRHPDYEVWLEGWRLKLSERFFKRGLDKSDDPYAWNKLVAKWCINESEHAWKTREPKTKWISPPRERPKDHPDLFPTKLNGIVVDW